MSSHGLKGPVNPLPVRVVQDGVTGELVLLPKVDVAGGDPAYFYQHIAVTTTPFGLPSIPVSTVIEDRYLRPQEALDEAVRAPYRRLWGSDTSVPYTQTHDPWETLGY